MKKIFVLTVLGLLFFGQPRPLSAQQPAPATDCYDQLDLRGGSSFRGQLVGAYRPGDSLVFRTWAGMVFSVSPDRVRRVVQRCADGKTPVLKAPFEFREHGWYHHTRAGVLAGQTYYREQETGFYVQHSSGWKFSRLLAAGIGAGAEIFTSGSGSDAATYPIFAEVTGFFQPKRISLFYNAGAGWAFAGERNGERLGYIDHWRGGWMAQAGVGYRIGQHFTIFGGIRLQRKVREWQSNWWGGGDTVGEDKVLQKRLMLSLGLLL